MMTTLELIREQSKIITRRNATPAEKYDARKEVYRLLKEAGMQDEDGDFTFSTGEKIGCPGISTLGGYKKMKSDKTGRFYEIYFYNDNSKLYV
ncbi:MAG: hypothetical protein H0X33_13395 [Taibaiella sp.]|nr:hypothetical protein [Taibaiella sp.]